MRYITFDTETTGLSFNKDRLIEFGAVLIEDGVIIDTYSTRINPLVKVGSGAFKVHGISNKMLEEELLFSEVAKDIVDYLKNAECVIAHNAKFDISFLYHSIIRMEDDDILDAFENIVVLDTLRYARTKYKNYKNDLDSLADRLDVDRESRRHTHGALVDSELLAGVISKIEDKHNIPVKYAKDWVTNRKQKKGDSDANTDK